MKSAIVLKIPKRNYTFQDMADAYAAALQLISEDVPLTASEVQPTEALRESVCRMNQHYLRSLRMAAARRTAVAVFLAGLLFFGTVLTVNAQVRQNVLIWWREIWEDRVLYLWDILSGGDSETAEYTLSYIPEGYELVESGEDENSGYVIYEGEEGSFIFEYNKTENYDGLQYIPLGDYTHWQVEVNGLLADVYQDNSEDNTYTIIQIDANHGYLWYLDAQIEWDVLYRIMQGINPR